MRKPHHPWPTTSVTQTNKQPTPPDEILHSSDTLTLLTLAMLGSKAWHGLKAHAEKKLPRTRVSERRSGAGRGSGRRTSQR